MSVTAKIQLALPDCKVLIIAWKEIIDAIRDRRTIITTIVLPLVLMPVVMVLPFYFMSPVRNPPKVGVKVLDHKAKFLSEPIIRFKLLRTTLLAETDDPEQLVANNTLDLAVVIPKNFTDSLFKKGKAVIICYHDPSNMRSEQALSFIGNITQQISHGIVVERLREIGVSEGILTPIELKSISVKAVSPAQQFAAMMLPYMIGFMAVLGGAHFVADSIAGEKERKTIEFLLTMPISRKSLIFGKFLGIMLLSLIAVFSQMIGLLVGISAQSKMFSEAVAQTTQSISLTFLKPTLVIIGLAILVISSTGNILLMCLAAFARTFREAQQYTSFLSISIIIPMMAFMYASPATLQKLLPVPILGPLVVIRNSILNILTMKEAVIAFSSSIVYLIIGAVIATKLLSSEKVIFRV